MTIRRILLAAIVWGTVVSPLLADRLLLKSGGELQGTWLNKSVHPREYKLQTPLGKFTVPADEVAKVEVAHPAEADYRQRLSQLDDTVEAHWEMSIWCRDHKLTPQRESHLRRILELDSDHSKARQLLGYIYRSGRWITQTDLMEGKGYVHADGRWRLGQEVELREQREELKQAEIDWMLRLRRLRESIDRDNARDVAEQFTKIRDPHAVPALRQLLHEDRWQPAKLMYLDTLRRIGTPAAVALLFDVSIREPDREIRLTSLEHLAAMDPPALSREYVKVLKSKNNVEVNRAAIGLRYLKDRSTIAPLIDALITQHTLVIPGASPDSTTSTFSPDGGSGFSTGGGKKELTGSVRNAEVLSTLTDLTGRSFGFDQTAWRAWRAAEAQALLQE